MTQIEYQSWNSGVSTRNYRPGWVFRIYLKSYLKSSTTMYFLFGWELSSQKAR